jgi:hypothetical protein
MTVAEMMERMPYAEYVLWTRFVAREHQQRELAEKMGGAG